MFPKVIFKNNSGDLIENYEHFIIDLWGVIHDGTAVYDGAIEALSHLRQRHKKIYFLSNAPRRADKVIATLEKYGITRNFYDFIITSGEASYLFLKENEENNFQKYGKNYYYIGPERDRGLVDGLNYNQVFQAKDADFILAIGFNHDLSTEDEQLEFLQEAAKYKLPLICVNPDFVVIKHSGQEILCAGLMAEQYEKMGGEVIYFGKPHQAIYESIFALANEKESSKFLAIGDGIETDIKGANNNKIDSALIPGGILSNILNIKYGKLPKEEDIIGICQERGIFPKFILAQL